MSDMQVHGPQWGGVSAQTPTTAGISGATRVQAAHGRYADAVLAGRVYWGANQSAATWSVALNTTHTGLVLSNPPNSGVNLHVLQAAFTLSVAPVAIATIGLFAGYVSAGIVTHTTPLTARNALINDALAAGKGLIDAAATLVGTPRWALPIMGGFTAGALPSTSPTLLDLGGLFVVAPGGYLGIGALTAVTGYGALVWEEVPIYT